MTRTREAPASAWRVCLQLQEEGTDRSGADDLPACLLAPPRRGVEEEELAGSPPLSLSLSLEKAPAPQGRTERDGDTSHISHGERQRQGRKWVGLPCLPWRPVTSPSRPCHYPRFIHPIQEYSTGTGNAKSLTTAVQYDTRGCLS